MKKVIHLITILSTFFVLPFFTKSLHAQYIKSGFDISLTQSNPKSSFEHFLKGVKYAYIELNPEEQALVEERGSVNLDNFVELLKEKGFKYVALTLSEKRELESILQSQCDVAFIKVQTSFQNNYFLNHAFEIKGCTGDWFKLYSNEIIPNNDHTLFSFKTLWEKMLGSYITNYDEANRLNLPTYPSGYNLQNLTAYFQSSANVLTNLEGIYEKISIDNTNKKYKIGIVQSGNSSANYDVVYLGGANNFKDWKEGEILAKIKATGTTNFYQATWTMPNKTKSENVFLTIDKNNLLEVRIIQNNKETLEKYYKSYPQRLPEPLASKSTGTGVALTSNGYIVTSLHVIENANTFVVESTINGIKRKYKASIVRIDPATDLAILKIDDNAFKTLPPVPYKFSTQLAKTGSEVFTLGYPLTGTMGTDVKLTNGIVSSTTGYQGDALNYQTSIAVQPGNSGGPLFDLHGNFLGVIKAKHADAENVTYAVKSRNILNLVELIADKVELPNFKGEQMPVSNTPLPALTEKYAPFVFLIRAY